MTEPSLKPSCHRKRRLRDRLFACLSLLVAAVWVGGTWWTATHVREYSSSRAVGGLIVAGMVGRAAPHPAGERQGSEVMGLPWLRFPAIPQSAPADSESAGTETSSELSHPDLPMLPLDQLTSATAYAEVVVYVWERVMYTVAGVLVLAAVAGLFTLWGRGSHLAAAAAILLSTAGTLVGMRLLVSPEGAAFHPLPLESYLLAGVGQSLYGLVLLIAFCPRGNRRPGASTL